MKALIAILAVSLLFDLLLFLTIEGDNRADVVLQDRVFAEPAAPVEPSLADIRLLKKQVQMLQSRLNDLDIETAEIDAGDSVSNSVSDDNQGNGRLERLAERVSTGRIYAGEDWFWAENGQDDTSIAFGSAEGLEVESVICRSDWCRVELDSYSSGDDLEDDLELQVRIDESLGRDTKIRFGERQGTRRVIFVQ